MMKKTTKRLLASGLIVCMAMNIQLSSQAAEGAGTKADVQQAWDVAELAEEEKQMVGIQVPESLYKTAYEVGECLDFGAYPLLVMRKYSDGSIGDGLLLYPTSKEVSGFDSSVPGEKTVTITVDGFQESFQVYVYGSLEEEPVESIEAGFSVFLGDVLEEMAIKVNYANGGSREKILTKNMIKQMVDVDLSSPGEKTAVLTYKGKTAEISGKVMEAESIEVGGNELIANAVMTDIMLKKTVYHTGEEVDLSMIGIPVPLGMSVITEYQPVIHVNYVDDEGNKNSISKDLTKDMISGFDTSTPGEKTVMVAYGGKTTSFPIYVSEDPMITEIEAVRMTSYYGQGEEFAPQGILKVTYDNGKVNYVALTDEGVSVSGFDTSVPGEKSYQISYGGKTISVPITVFEIQSVELYSSKEIYTTGEKPELGLLVRCNGIAYSINLTDVNFC